MRKGALSQGAAIVWRHQRALWWLFLVNFLLALIGTVPVAVRLAPILNHSLASERLVKEFDPAVLIELAMQPSHPFNAVTTPTLLGLVYLVFVLFVEGGVLKLYGLDQKLSLPEFFEACGCYFWRFARLLIATLIGCVPLFALAGAMVHLSNRLSESTPEFHLGIWVGALGLLAVLFLMLALRLWVDLAQVCVVVENEQKIIKALRKAFGLGFRNFFALYWLYLRPSLLAWAILGGGSWVWLRLFAPGTIDASFLFGELLLLIWLASRLWQRAGEVVWWGQNTQTTPAQP